MKNKKAALFLVLTFLLSGLGLLKAQTGDEILHALENLKTRGEVIIRFRMPKNLSLDELTHNLSIDNRKEDTLTAYASEKQFDWFLDKQIAFEVIAPRILKNAKQAIHKSTGNAWNAYPPYAEYLQMMESYARDFPDHCILQEFGTSVSGRKLLAVKISDNASKDEAEPVFLYTSTMHGDEGTGFILLLRLIDSLLTAYGSNPEIKQLVDHTEIWINPLANPDGFYFESDGLFFNSIRGNANYVDLNRNFPDALAGDHPNDAAWQPETIAMIDFMKQHKIVLAANLHDGAELVNYPWDNRYARHADDSWYFNLARQFADTVQKYGPAGFFTDENNGITNGYDWYLVYGSRQDYVNYFLHGREVTIELSHVKSPDPLDLPAYWNYYKKSLIRYMQEIQTGLHGTVTDAITGAPLKAMIEIPGYDKDSSQVISSYETGEFYRMLSPGSYTLNVTSSGYKPQTLDGILVNGETKNTLVQLTALTDEISPFPNPFNNAFSILLNEVQSGWINLTIRDVTGRSVYQKSLSSGTGLIRLNGLDWLTGGVYYVEIRYDSRVRIFKTVKIGK